MKYTTASAGEFKARCLKLLDGVARTGNCIVITKRGRPIAGLARSGGGPAR
jgi:prevent-host-death family protein